MRDSRRKIRSYFLDRHGASAVYLALVAPLLLGTGVLAVDVGRLVVLRSQMQNAADAVAISAANQLNGDDGSRDRATSVANNVLNNQTRLADDSMDLSTASVAFYAAIAPSKVVATNDAEALYVEVNLTPRSANTILDSLLNMAANNSAKSVVTLNANATATPVHIVCDVPPLMVCDPAESDSNLSFRLPQNAGRQMLIKPGPSSGKFAPGNYGLLCPAEGNCGSSNVGDTLAAEDPGSCFGESDGTEVDTSPGVQTNQVRNGINARFDLGNQNPKKPSKNIIAYDRDSNMNNPNIILGNSNWNPNSYWNTYHGSELEPANLSTYTRYQVHLYEMGVSFARKGKQTIYPVPSNLPAGYTVVNPPGESIPPEGDPKGQPSDKVKRRVVKVAVLKCDALDVKGSGTYPTFGYYVEMFLTEEVGKPPAADVYGEVIGPVSLTAPDDYHANIRIVD
ncbi:MAG: pilus assembly protein [Alphaproteobacteria bacterium]